MPLDILLGENGDLLIENGDLVIGESTAQHQRLLLLSNKGDWKESPTCGVGVKTWLKDEDAAAGFLGEIKKEFEKDGMTVKSIGFTEEKLLQINAHY